MIKVSPSILAADFSRLFQEVQGIERGGADMIHFDVMDGDFVPNITFGPPVIKSLRPLTKLPFDVHLMVRNPDPYLEDFKASGSDYLTVHVETCVHLHRTLRRIKDSGMKAGVALNPATSPAAIEHVLDEVDLILVMSVNPGFGGQGFISSATAKIEKVSTMVKANPSAIISVDGGINEETARLSVRAGANALVAGSFIFKAPDYGRAISILKRV